MLDMRPLVTFAIVPALRCHNRTGVSSLGLKFLMQANFRTAVIRRVLLGLALAVSVGQALATLGQAPSSPQTPATPSAPTAKRQATTSVAQNGLYTLHETLLENGTSVREYATPAGVVFALAWRGPVLPDLSQLLGNYFPAFKAATEQDRKLGKRGSPVNIESAGLVVSSGGRMRDFFGHAYAPALIPSGVNVKDVLQ